MPLYQVTPALFAGGFLRKFKEMQATFRPIAAVLTCFVSKFRFVVTPCNLYMNTLGNTKIINSTIFRTSELVPETYSYTKFYDPKRAIMSYFITLENDDSA